jgi:exodeoxyribonuclease III
MTQTLETGASLKIGTWNVNGIRARLDQLQEWVRAERPDVFCGKDFPAKMQFLTALDAFAAASQAEGGSLVICGDLNVARTDRDVHPKERKPRAIGQLPEERALLEQIIGRGLVDVGRALDPDNDQLFTWWAPWREMRQRNIGWRLDYVLVSEPLFARVRRSTVQRDFGTSDHAPVTVEMAPSLITNH